MKQPVSMLRAAAMSKVVGPALVKAQSVADRARRLLRRRAAPAGASAPALFGPPLAAGRRLKELISLYYLEGRYAAGTRPVAWVTSGVPVEVLRALGYYIAYPENHAALCSARHLGAGLCAVAEQAGYSRDLCSYARIDIGSLLSGKTPVGSIPRPDLLLACTNICQTVVYWFRTLSRQLGVPLVVLDTPFVHGQPRHHARLYVRDQLRALAQLAEEQSGRRLEAARFEQVLHHSRTAVQLWREVLELARCRPAPWGAFDMFVFMAPIVVLRGLPSAVSFYQTLKKELLERSKQGIGGIRRERLRLLWDNLPIWYRMRRLSHLFAERGAALVGASYTHAWATAADLLDPGSPWLSLADAYMQVYLNQDLRLRRELLSRLCRDMAVDGVIFHSNRSCKSYSIGQREIADWLQQTLGIRCLVLEADHADERAYSDEAVESRLEAFLESFGS
ncbi:MAG: 2-hydroxyacyl-CoA dehydratase [Deltaproteobacteria bacterium]|nr:2-hydroxyacyl-CoA dehydratase [Deltaproteobacteria bacterium]